MLTEPLVSTGGTPAGPTGGTPVPRSHRRRQLHSYGLPDRTGELPQRLQFQQRAPRVEVRARHRAAGREVRREAADDEAGGGVQDDHVALRTAIFAGEDGPENRGVLLAVTAAE